MVKLRNLKRRARCFNLEHPTFKNETGSNGLGKPESLTFKPLEVLEVHPDALLCREIRSALAPKAGRPTLRVVG